MKIISLITARGGSTEIPKKNIIDINGKPLISYSILASISSVVDETWVSTDSDEIAEISKTYGANVSKRPSYLADNIIMPDPTLVHFAKDNKFDIMVFIQPTSPFIKPKYIDKGINMMLKGGFDSMVAVTKEHWLPRWDKDVKPIGWEVNDRPRRQDRPATYAENGMFYMTTYEMLIKTNLRYGGKIGMVKIPLRDSFQIDSHEDPDLIRDLF